MILQTYMHVLQPKLHEEEAWCVFCFGEDFWQRLRWRRGKQTAADCAGNEEPTQHEGTHKGVPPLLSIVSAMEQVHLSSIQVIVICSQ